VVHPLVLRHPHTGVPGLYLNVGLTAGVLGYNSAQWRDVMAAIDRHYSRPGASYRHHWLPGDVAVADNLRVAHKAAPLTAESRRILNRTTVRAGDRFTTKHYHKCIKTCAHHDVTISCAHDCTSRQTTL